MAKTLRTITPDQFDQPYTAHPTDPDRLLAARDCNPPVSALAFTPGAGANDHASTPRPAR